MHLQFSLPVKHPLQVCFGYHPRPLSGWQLESKTRSLAGPTPGDSLPRRRGTLLQCLQPPFRVCLHRILCGLTVTRITACQCRRGRLSVS
eukprot:2663075-Rhodomonas_salina.2